MRPFVPAVALLSLLCAPPADAVVRKMFVTSVAGTGKLSNWDDANGMTGVEAGDAICQARALDAGLDNVSGFRAWLSDSNDDAYCRIHGLTGNKDIDKCGQIDLPVAAGPWTIADTGSPFGAAIEDLLYPSFEVYSTPSYDEFGDPVGGAIWTGTNFYGALDYADCGQWNSEDPSPTTGTTGSTDLTGFGWTYTGAIGCDQMAHLLCFEIGAGDPLPPFEFWGRLAFVTFASGSGELGAWPEAHGEGTGIAAGDAICRHQASDAGLPYPDSFKAWLSDDTTHAKDRFQNDGPWIRLDRASVAFTKSDLVDALIDAPINFTQTHAYLNAEAVWTGTATDGTAESLRCDNWKDGTAGSNGQYGTANARGPAWTSDAATACDETAHLYCLQDLPMIFADGFESGDTNTW